MKPVLVSPLAEHIEYLCYPDHIPTFAEDALERLHASRYSSLAHFQVYGHADGASTYVVRRNGEPALVLLYRRSGAVLRVLNESIPLSVDDARRCAAQLLQGPDAAGAVLFRAVAMPPAPGGGLMQRVECEQDSVMTLPATRDAYLAGLGERTRALIKNRLNKVRREQPSFRFDLYEKQAVDPCHARAIIGLHRARLLGKPGTMAIDAEEEQRVLQMIARCGIVGVATIDGRCCGGAICYRQGDIVSARVLSHDTSYDVYRMGFLCAYLMCSGCVEGDGIREFNFGWGREHYKSLLGGQPRVLSDVAIYRSHYQRLRLARLGLSLSWRGLAYRLRRGWHAFDHLKRKGSPAKKSGPSLSR